MIPPGPRRQHARRGGRSLWRPWLAVALVGGVAVAAVAATLFNSTPPPRVTGTNPITSASPVTSPGRTAAPLPTPKPTPEPSASATPGPTGPLNVYAATGVGMFAAAVSGMPERVYVPDEATGTVIEIDPATFRVIARYAVGASPEHVTPDWGLGRLYVESTYAFHLVELDPRTGGVVGAIPVAAPYNLYFSLDGQLAFDVVDRAVGSTEYAGTAQLYVYDRATWHLRRAIDIPYAGANHLDFSADGGYLLLSTEYAGWVVKLDVASLTIVGRCHVGGHPTDVRLSPDGRVFFVANQGRGGVSVIDPGSMREIAFIRTGTGAHGLAISRDATRLYVTNRLAGSLSVIDTTTRRVLATWRIGGNPDMIAVSPDGGQLWISNRFNGTVTVVAAATGRVLARIRVGGRPHGLAFFPEPGRFSLGHNGNMR